MSLRNLKFFWSGKFKIASRFKCTKSESIFSWSEIAYDFLRPTAGLPSSLNSWFKSSSGMANPHNANSVSWWRRTFMHESPTAKPFWVSEFEPSHVDTRECVSDWMEQEVPKISANSTGEKNNPQKLTSLRRSMRSCRTSTQFRCWKKEERSSPAHYVVFLFAFNQ